MEVEESSSSSEYSSDEKQVDTILDVKSLLARNTVESDRNSLIDVDLGNLLAIDKQEYHKGFDVKAVSYGLVYSSCLFGLFLMARQAAVQELFTHLFQLPIHADEYSMGMQWLETLRGNNELIGPGQRCFLFSSIPSIYIFISFPVNSLISHR
jgi:hypothetical protein